MSSTTLVLRALRALRGLGAAAAVVLLASCGDSPTQPVGGNPGLAHTGTLAMYAQTNQIVAGTLVVQVSGPGILKADNVTPDTLAFNIPITNGVASGSITIPAGPSRVITVRAFDGLTETHRGTVVTNIVEGNNPTITVTLVPLVGDVTITVSFGTTIVVVRPLIATMAVGDTLRLTAEIRDQNGALIAGRVRWATLNPARASVDTLGLVTMRDTGEVQIVATYGTVGGSARLSGTPVTSAVSYELTWNGSVSRAWSDAANWTPHGIGAQRVPSASDSVVITAGPANQPRIETCSDVSARDLVIQAGASLGTTCNYGVNVYRRTLSRGTITAPVILRPGARFAGVFDRVYVRGDTVALADSVRAASLQLDGSSPTALSLNGRRLTVTGNLTVNSGTLSLVEGDTLTVLGDVSWSGDDHTSKLTGGVVYFRGSNFYGYRYRASGTSRLVFDRAIAGQQTLSGMDYYGTSSGLAKWDIRNRDGVRLCSSTYVNDSLTVTSTGTPLVVETTSCGSYQMHTYGPVISSANTQLGGYSWELNDSTGTANIGGSWTATYTEIRATTSRLKPTLAYQNLGIHSSMVKVTGPMTIGAQLVLDGGGTDFILDGHTVTVGTVLSTGNGALLTMNNAADTLRVAGSVNFGDGNTRLAELARLTAGVLEVGGSFYAYGFNAAGSHKVRFTAPSTANASVSGMSAAYYGHAFQNMELAANASLGISCVDATVRGTLGLRSGAALIDNGCSGSLRVEGDIVTDAGSDAHPYRIVVAAPTGTSNVAGAWTPQFTDFSAIDAPVKASLGYVNLRFFAGNKLIGNTSATGHVLIEGPGVDLNVNGRALTIGSYLSVSNSGTLTMQNAADSVEVADYAAFSSDMSGTEVNRLTAGVLRLGGYLYGYGFSAGGSHRVVLTGLAPGNHYVGSMSAYYRPAQGFQNLELTSTANYYVCEQPRVKGTLRLRAGSALHDTGCYQPTLRVDGDLVTEAGSSLRPYTVQLFNASGTQNVLGSFTPAWTSINTALQAGQLKPGLGYTNMAIAAAVTLPDTLTVNGDLTITGTGTNLTLNGKRLKVTGQLDLNDNATITMTSATDSLDVGGRVWWDGGASENGKLTNGVAVFRGESVCATNYYGTGAHRTVFERAGGTVRLECVNYYTPTQQPFAHVDVRGGGLSLNGNMYAGGKVRVASGAKIDQVSYNGTLFVQDTLFTATGSAVTNGPLFPGNHQLSVILADSSGTSQVNGSYDPAGTYFQGLHAAIKPSLGYRYTRIDRSTGFSGNTVIDGQLDVINDGTSVALAGHTVEVRGGLNFDNQSTMRMDQDADTLLVGTGDPAADVYWDGADNVGLLTKGVVKFYGDRFYAPQYHASGTNRVVFASNATGAVVSVEGTPTFAKMDLAGTRGVSINGRGTITDSLRILVPTLLTGNDYFVVGGAFSSVAGSDVTANRIYLDGNDGTRNVAGRFRPVYAVLRGAAPVSDALKPGLEYQSLQLEGQYALTDSTAVAGDLVVNGSAGELKLNGRKLKVSGSVDIQYGANLRMMDELNRDTLVVLGDHLRFNYYSGKSTLMAGVILMSGNNVYVDHDSVNASGSHRLVMNGAGTGTQNVYLNNNGMRRLQNLDVTGSRNVQLPYGGYINNQVRVTSAVSLGSSNTVHVGGELSSVTGSALSFGYVLELGDPTGTASILGSYANTYITRFLTGSQTIAVAANKSYSTIEVGGAGTVSGGALTIGGNLELTNSSATLTVPTGSTFGGSVNTYGALSFAGSASAVGDLNVRAGGSATAQGASPSTFADFRYINLNGPSSPLAGGVLDNSIVNSGGGGFRYKAGYAFNNWGTPGGLIGPAPTTHP